MNKHYVYRHVTIDGETIYIGIGRQGRAYEIDRRDGYHRNIIKDFEHNYVEFGKTNLTRDEAVALERKLILEEDPRCNIQWRR